MDSANPYAKCNKYEPAKMTPRTVNTRLLERLEGPILDSGRGGRGTNAADSGGGGSGEVGNDEGEDRNAAAGRGSGGGANRVPDTSTKAPGGEISRADAKKSVCRVGYKFVDTVSDMASRASGDTAGSENGDTGSGGMGGGGSSSIKGGGRGSSGVGDSQKLDQDMGAGSGASSRANRGAGSIKGSDAGSR